MTNFTFKSINIPSSQFQYISVAGVDAAGLVVGTYSDTQGDSHGFVATLGGSFSTLDPPLGIATTSIVGITASGEIYGNYTDDLTLVQHGFVDNNGVFSNLDDPTLFSVTTLAGVTDAGVAFGDYEVPDEFGNPTGAGFVDVNGSFTTVQQPGATFTFVNGITAGGEIFGDGFVDNNGTFTPIAFPGADGVSSVAAITASGEIVGTYLDGSQNYQTFTDVNGTYAELMVPGAVNTELGSVTAAGEIVGSYGDSAGNVHGFIDLNGTITTVDVPGATETDIAGINAAGEIYGFYNDNKGVQHGFVGLPVPIVNVGDVTATHDETFPVANLFTVTDPDGAAIKEFVLWDQGAGGAQVLLNNVAQASQQNIDLTPTQLAQTTYKSGSGADVLWIQVYDGLLWSDWTSFTITGPVDPGPVVTAANVTAAKGQVFAAASLFTALDPDGDPITQYILWDKGVGGGEVLVNNVAQADDQNIPLTPTQLAHTTYQAGLGTDVLWVQAFDGTVWGNWTSFTVSGLLDTPPVVTAANVNATHAEVFAAGSLFTAHDPDGDPITQYILWDKGAGGAEVLVNNVAQASGQNIDLTPGELAHTTYKSGSGPDVLWVQAYDGTQWSSWTSLTVTGPVDSGPVVTPTHASIVSVQGQMFAAAGLFTYSDPFNSPATQYNFWNSGGGGGKFLLNGNPLPTQQNDTITPMQLSQLKYEVGSGTDTLWIQANDGTVWGNWVSFTISDPPTVPAGGTLELPSAFQGALGFAGSAGTLELEQSSSFAGTLSGLGGDDRVDLADIAFGRDTTVAYRADGGTGGTLSVSDGFHAANLSLLGQYTAASFSLASDGHGGTLVSAAETQPQALDLHARG